MLHATNELQGAALDWAVAKCEGTLHDDNTASDYWQPSENWEQGGPIIERETIDIEWTGIPGAQFFCAIQGEHEQSGDTPLVAAMRCYVESKLGDEVEIPEELK